MAERAPCEWREDQDGIWQTGCDQKFVFIDSGPKENKMRYCCYCGRELTLTAMTEAHAYEERRATSLREERDKCTKAGKLWQEREAALMEALRDYGAHRTSCAMRRPRTTEVRLGMEFTDYLPPANAECDCGFARALASGPASAQIEKEQP